MSNATASLTPPYHPDHYGRPTFLSLVSGEVLRLRSRRLVKVVLAAALVLVALVMVSVAFTTGSPSAAERATAQSLADEDYNRCLQFNANDPNVPKDVSPEALCGSPDASLFLAKQPFDFADSYPDTVIVFAVGVALLLFLIGASAGGAEWSARTMPALLYWEPRRLRVMGAKIAVLSGFAVVVSVVAQVLTLAVVWLLSVLRGSNPAVPLPDDFWVDALGTAGRGAIFAVLVVLGGFALANLTRNTGAALGVAFVYFAIIENLVGGVLPRFARWSVAVNVGGFLNPGGIGGVPTGVKTSVEDSVGLVASTMSISNARGGLVLTLIVVTFLAVATILFTRRDVT